MLPALAPVYHEVGEPLLPLFHFLLAKGLKQTKNKVKRQESETNTSTTNHNPKLESLRSPICPGFTEYTAKSRECKLFDVLHITLAEN